MTRYQQINDELKRLLAIIVAEPNVRRVIVFGSATGERDQIHQWSDIDLCIVEDTDLRFYDRLAAWIKKLQPRIGLDLVVYTPSEVQDMREKSDFFTKEIESKGKELYAA